MQLGRLEIFIQEFIEVNNLTVQKIRNIEKQRFKEIILQVNKGFSPNHKFFIFKELCCKKEYFSHFFLKKYGQKDYKVYNR